MVLAYVLPISLVLVTVTELEVCPACSEYLLRTINVLLHAWQYAATSNLGAESF